MATVATTRYKAMEAALTPAAKVRRQLKAGRPSKIANQTLTAFDALQRVVNEADRARAMMVRAGLSPDDVHLALIVRTDETVGLRWLPQPGTPDAAEYFSSIVKITPAPTFLGILWHQADDAAAAKGQPRDVVWVTQFMAGDDAERLMLAVRDFFVAGGHKTQDN
jgi:hypothetical protein